ncbi:hypothetical protein [Clostridium sp. HBUAS56017]|uniref:hypothetical protein n=1 Tax=Clostridium sp. HBUAS56017 TaxID=2571128 RepID=UPI0011776F9A|nr:hypothetical protein [Clostridium sp. HBUAS56017]
MLDINTINKRYFNIKIGDLTLDVEPPKIKALKKITALSKANDESAMDELTEAVKLILSKNKKKCKVPEKVIDELDLDQIQQILIEFFKWLSESKNSPN